MAFLLTFSGGASATYKDAVRVVTGNAENIALTGSHSPTPLTIDTIALADKDRVLLRGQTNAAENGIYVYSVSGSNYTLTRSLDANNSNEVLPNMLVPVSEGLANADKVFQLSSYQTPPAAPEVGPIVLDTTELTFTDVLIGLANKADRDLANLLPTSINQNLLFADDTSYNIGAAAASRPQTLYVKSAINLASLTASEILGSDASKNIVSLPVATYPSLTELSYVKGVTSALQTQLNAKVDSVSGTAPIASSGGVTPTISISQSGAAQDGYLSSTDWNTFNNKQPAGNYITALTGEVTASGPGSAAATIANSAVTNAKLANMADVTIKGNNSGAPAAPSDLSASTVTSMLNAFQGSTSLVNGVKGLVPQPLIGDELKFLCGDGTWTDVGLYFANKTLSNLDAPTAVNVALLGTLGSESAPAYSFTGDVDTGMWSSGANTLNFSTNSNERIRITSAGLVGIGTTSPGQALTVVASSSGAIASLRNTAVAGYSAMSMFNNSGGEVAGFGFANASASLPLLRDKTYLFSINRDLLFTYNYSTGDGIIIKNGGNVGIGTLTPGEKLEVGGNLLVANHAVITQTLRPRDGVGSAQHDILLRGGDGLTGNHDGGDVTIQGGLKNGTGADGEIIFKVLGAEAAKISASNNLDLSCGLIVNSAHAQAGTADVITVADDDFYVGVDCSLAAKTVNLPTAVAGKKLVIKDESGDASTNNITVSGTIDGATNYVMSIDYEAVTLVSDGTNWFII